MKAFLALLAGGGSAGNMALEEMRREIQALDFNCSFLVAGFDSQGPHIFVISPPGIEEHYDSIGFWSIGSGSHSALSSLLFRKASRYDSLLMGIYYVAEAKFMAESAQGVGKHTPIMILKADGTYGYLTDASTNVIRKIWENEGKPPMPNNLETRIGEIGEVKSLFAVDSTATPTATLS